MEERRRFVRLDAGVNVEYNISDTVSKEQLKATTRNIAAGGICLIMLEPMRPGAILDFKLYLPADSLPVIATGRVAWAHKFSMGSEKNERFDVGVEFVDINDYDRERISKHIFKSFGQMRNMGVA